MEMRQAVEAALEMYEKDSDTYNSGFFAAAGPTIRGGTLYKDAKSFCAVGAITRFMLEPEELKNQRGTHDDNVWAMQERIRGALMSTVQQLKEEDASHEERAMWYFDAASYSNVSLENAKRLLSRYLDLTAASAD